jgi:hypothetical protein
MPARLAQLAQLDVGGHRPLRPAVAQETEREHPQV